MELCLLQWPFPDRTEPGLNPAVADRYDKHRLDAEDDVREPSPLIECGRASQFREVCKRLESGI